MPLSRL
jgi:predicted ATPase